MMEYKGYLGQVDFNDAAGIFHGEVVNMRDVVTFQGPTVDILRQAFRDSVDDYLEWCAERGKAPEKPFSGKFVVRVDPEIHRSISQAAQRAGKSLNSWVTEHLSRALGKRKAS